MTNESATSYPLCWPAGRALVPPHLRDKSNFRTSTDRARRGLEREVSMLGATNLVISTNVPIRKDGRPYASGYRLDDEAVAVYFNYYGRSMCFACDRWLRLGENMHAIAKTVEALRGIARWGTGDMLERAFTGFAALPAPMAVNAPWWEVLGVMEKSGPDGINGMYRVLRSRFHPDKPGGDAAKFDAVQKAFDQAVAEGRA